MHGIAVNHMVNFPFKAGDLVTAKDDPKFTVDMTYFMFDSAEKVRKDADQELPRDRTQASTSQFVIVSPVLEDNAQVSTWMKRLPEVVLEERTTHQQRVISVGERFANPEVFLMIEGANERNAREADAGADHQDSKEDR